MFLFSNTAGTISMHSSNHWSRFILILLSEHNTLPNVSLTLVASLINIIYFWLTPVLRTLTMLLFWERTAIVWFTYPLLNDSTRAKSADSFSNLLRCLSISRSPPPSVYLVYEYSFQYGVLVLFFHYVSYVFTYVAMCWKCYIVL